MKTLKLFLTFVFISIVSFGQNPNRQYLSHKEENNKFEVVTNDGNYIFQFYSNSIIETTFVPKGDTHPSVSHAVVSIPIKLKTTYSYVGNQITYGSSGLSVTITTKPFQISYYYEGKPIISEKRGYFKAKHEPLDFVKGNIIAEETERIEFNLTSDEVLYGAGARALSMNRRGYKLPLFNRAHYGYETHSELMNFTLPIVVSSKQYMIHFDNAPIGYLDLDSKKDNTLTYETISGRKTYQIITGDDWEEVIENYTDLTGKQPLPPRWALGNFSSRFGYHSQQETETTIDAFKQENIPVDAVILDLYWFGKEVKGTMGNLAVYKDSFPDFRGMVSRLNQKGVKTVLITEPFVLTTSNRWDEAVKEDVLAKDSTGNPYTYDFYFGNTGLIDIYKPEAEQWFWNIYKELADIGVAGVWGDLGEPEVHPYDIIHHTGTGQKVHNIYGHDWARLVFEGYERDFPNQRPFILMRAGYSGSQRYALMPWSGDVNRTWGGLQSQPEIALQMGMQGLAYMHSDLGGFAGANLDDELYTRWLQYGVFQPIYRPHAQEDVPSEPVFREDKTKQLAKQSIELRYKLMPYNYNLAHINSTKGTPLMRPLFFEDSNPDYFVNASTYFWGKDFLISPILKPSKKEKEVHFPDKTVWFDFYTDEKFEGGQTKTVKTLEHSIPTYVRAGAFIPMTKVVQSTKEYSFNNFDLHYYHDESVKNSEREFYNDDGLTNNTVENEAFEILEFEFEQKKRCVEFEFDAEIGKNYKSEEKHFNLIIHNLNKEPKRVKLSRNKIEVFNYNKEAKTLTIPVSWNTSQEIELKIKLKR